MNRLAPLQALVLAAISEGIDILYQDRARPDIANDPKHCGERARGWVAHALGIAVRPVPGF